MRAKNKDFFEDKKHLDAKDLRFGIVVSNWNKEITDNMYEGCYSTLIKSGVKKDNIITNHVPGGFELVFGAKKMDKNNVDAIICIGSVIQGETKHFDFICNSIALGVKDLNIMLDTPVIFGVLTDNNIGQAMDRSGGKLGNKGIESAIAAIEMALLNKR
jgi:6,7-dimethyl-8-ribityllumazine synthase